MGLRTSQKRRGDSHLFRTFYAATNSEKLSEEDNRLMAHAWLRSGAFILTGGAGRERFTIISTFAEKPQRDDRASRVSEAVLAVFDHEALPGRDAAIAHAHLVEHLEVCLPAVRRHCMADVAALVVEELDVRVLGK